MIRPETFVWKINLKALEINSRQAFIKQSLKYPGASSYIKDNTTNHKYMYPLILRKNAVPYYTTPTAEFCEVTAKCL